MLKNIVWSTCYGCCVGIVVVVYMTPIFTFSGCDKDKKPQPQAEPIVAPREQKNDLCPMDTDENGNPKKMSPAK